MMSLKNYLIKALTNEDKSKFIEKIALENVDINALRFIYTW